MNRTKDFNLLEMLSVAIGSILIVVSLFFLINFYDNFFLYSALASGTLMVILGVSDKKQRAVAEETT